MNLLCRTPLLPALLLAACLLAPTSAARAGGDSPAGLWQTVDDKDGKPRGLVRVTDTGGELRAVIEKGLRPDDRGDKLCENCPGERRGKPMIGLTIMSGMKREGDVWVGGEILDPDSGHVYRCRVALADGGRKLEVRGFIGVMVLGRTQIWTRVE